MANLDYYQKERAEHAVANATLIPFAAAEKLLRYLAKRGDVKLGTIAATHGHRMSAYQPWDRKIVLRCDEHEQVRLLTVVHEFAHAADAMGRERAGQSVISGGDRRWHSEVHAGHVRFFLGIVNDESLVSRFVLEVEREAEQARDREIARKLREAARSAPLAVRARKIERRREQVTKLERRIKALTTRLATARRSLAALERAEQKAAMPSAHDMVKALREVIAP